MKMFRLLPVCKTWGLTLSLLLHIQLLCKSHKQESLSILLLPTMDIFHSFCKLREGEVLVLNMTSLYGKHVFCCMLSVHFLESHSLMVWVGRYCIFLQIPYMLTKKVLMKKCTWKRHGKSLVKAVLLAFTILHAKNREKQGCTPPQNTLKKNMVWTNWK